MKHIMILLTVCLLCVCFFGCNSETSNCAEGVSFTGANFNNDFWFSGNFWAFEDDLFYLRDGYYNLGAYWAAGANTEKLFEESDFANESVEHTQIGDFFVSENWLYFELVTEKQDMLYRCDLTNGTYEPVCEIPFLYRWAVMDNYFIYLEHPKNNGERRYPLCIYNLKEGTTTQICSNVEEFGVINGQLRYITYGDEYALYQFDFEENCSAAIGTFGCEFDDKYDVFNFVLDGVVMLNWGRENGQNLVVYTLSSNSTAVYTFPKEIQRMVAYDQFAYAVVYDTHKNSSDAVASEENGIYRIHLTDGSYEAVQSDASEGTNIHVISDDCVYILQRKMNLLFQARTHIYKFDYQTGDKEKLIII